MKTTDEDLKAFIASVADPGSSELNLAVREVRHKWCRKGRRGSFSDEQLRRVIHANYAIEERRWPHGKPMEVTPFFVSA